MRLVVGECFKLKPFFRDLGRKMIEALIIDRLFIAFARLVQKVFWACAGISTYVVILIATKKDGREQLANILKHLWLWRKPVSCIWCKRV